MELSKLLKEDEVTLVEGDYLVAHTNAWGYVPTHKDTQGVHSGRYLFKVVAGKGVGNLNVVPMELDAEGKVQSADESSPIVVIEGDKVTYVTGRNHNDYKDAYNGAQVYTVEDITAGREHREAILGFLEFTQSQFSLGVNDFKVQQDTKIDKVDAEA